MFDTAEPESERLPADQELRKRGYKIHARPSGGPAIWTKDGKLYRQVRAGCVLLEQEKQLRK